MCLIVFVASDVQLPVLPFDESLPGFTISYLKEDEQTVRRHFTKPNLYNVGAVGGCGCGFGYDGEDLEALLREDVPEEVKVSAQLDYNTSVESVRRLKAFVALATTTGTAEVYCCWWGDWDQRPEAKIEVTLDHFGGDAFHLAEKQFLTVRSH